MRGAVFYPWYSEGHCSRLPSACATLYLVCMLTTVDQGRTGTLFALVFTFFQQVMDKDAFFFFFLWIQAVMPMPGQSVGGFARKPGTCGGVGTLSQTDRVAALFAGRKCERSMIFRI